jgi:hypothetical protein
MNTALTVVATSRNDGHGGDLIERMQWFVDGLDFRAEEAGTTVELIMVEWNPPRKAPPLAEVLRWPSADSNLTVRIVTVPPEVHDRFEGAGRLPLFQMIAKNVGIRRATADQVLATNIDVLFSKPLFGLMVGAIDGGTLYRADRHDVDFPFHRAMSMPDALDYCARFPIRMMRSDGAHYPGRGRVMANYRGVVDYVLFQPRRFRQYMHERETGTSSGAGAEGTRNRLTFDRAVTWGVRKARTAVDLVRLPQLHTNACGDFTLLTRDDWSTLRGYPEWPMYSWNLDSVLLYQAAALGMREVDLPSSMALFHMEHEKGSGWTPEGRFELFGRLDRGGVEYLTDWGLRQEAMALLRRAKRGDLEPFNDSGWGLAEENLPSQVCVG